MAKETHLPEFPTAWHQERYIEDLERELEGRKARMKELKAFDNSPLLEQTESEIEAVKTELKRLGKGQTGSAKRPRGGVEKETR